MASFVCVLEFHKEFYNIFNDQEIFFICFMFLSSSTHVEKISLLGIFLLLLFIW